MAGCHLPGPGPARETRGDWERAAPSLLRLRPDDVDHGDGGAGQPGEIGDGDARRWRDRVTVRALRAATRSGHPGRLHIPARYRRRNHATFGRILAGL